MNDLWEIMEPMLKGKNTLCFIRQDQKLKDILEDSLSLIELALEIEYQYKIVIPDADLKKLNTVGDLFSYVSRKYEEKQKCA